ncbi:MAG: BamA/TamA family outer membrane protein [Geminocystis sp.]|nr:BamA/TamA family outer membrane protein [Geminocystis sp.]
MKKKFKIRTIYALCYGLFTSLLFPNNALANDNFFDKPQEIIGQNFGINNIEVRGNSIFQTEIESLISEHKNRNVSKTELEEIASKITQLYLNEGYITTRAVLEEIRGNTAIIQVYEGEIEAIEIQGGGRLENYVRERVSLGTTSPFNSGKLEDQLRLLKADPLIEKIQATLKPGSRERGSILEVKVTPSPPLFGNIGINNNSPPSVGDVEVNLGLGYRNPLGLGDTLSISYQPRVEDWTGTYSVELNYSVPVNPMDGRINARVSIQENKIVEGPFKPLDIRGETQYYEINFRQPVLRTPREELALSLGLGYRHGQTFTFFGPTPFGIGPDKDGISETSVLTFGQEYVLREKTGAWGLRSQIRVGTGIFGATKAVIPGAPDGFFVAWLGQVQRIQVLSPDNILIIQGDVQIAFDPLLTSEQFVIGGGDSVRGYRQNVRTGDNGFRFLIEDRITLARNENLEPAFQLAPFFNMGSVWNVRGNPNILPDQRFIAALGLGMIWQPTRNLNLRLDIAPPLIDLKDRGNNIQDDGFHFSVNYSF